MTYKSLRRHIHLKLQKSSKGMKAILAMTKITVMMDPDQVGPGHCVQWAATLPTRSQELNTRKFTGTK